MPLLLFWFILQYKDLFWTEFYIEHYKKEKVIEVLASIMILSLIGER